MPYMSGFCRDGTKGYEQGVLDVFRGETKKSRTRDGAEHLSGVVMEKVIKMIVGLEKIVNVCLLIDCCG